jgi:hypothetical protein
VFFVAFFMQWGPNGDQIGSVKLQNGSLWLLNCKMQAKIRLKFRSALTRDFPDLQKLSG